MTWQARDQTKKAFKARAVGKHISDVCIDASLHGETIRSTTAVAGPIEYHKWYAQLFLDTNGIIVKIK